MYPHPTRHLPRCYRYGLTNFIGDCVMTVVTCGFWLIWVFVREMRQR